MAALDDDLGATASRSLCFAHGANESEHRQELAESRSEEVRR